MRVLKKKKELLALALSALLIVSGCGASGEGSKNDDTSSVTITNDADADGKGTEEQNIVESDVSDEDTLTIAINDEINNIDIIHAYSYWVDLVLNGIAEGLFYYDSDSQVQSRLVESYEHPDEKTYIYTIKSGVTFSTGDPLTADDVVFSLERQRNPENGGELSWMFENVESIENI